jgi:hypothetical protein
MQLASNDVFLIVAQHFFSPVQSLLFEHAILEYTPAHPAGPMQAPPIEQRSQSAFDSWKQHTSAGPVQSRAAPAQGML